MQKATPRIDLSVFLEPHRFSRKQHLLGSASVYVLNALVQITYAREEYEG
jgi:hypothetical protein